MGLSQSKRQAAVRKELLSIQKQEARLQKAALKERNTGWKDKLESVIPEKVYSGLDSAFGKAFSLVFDQGRGIIEKSYKKDAILEDHAIRDYAVQVRGSRRELRKLEKNAKRADLLNLTVTTVEGIGLGALGVGMPDIVLFISTLLKGVYETALHYGCGYEARGEQLLILKMLAAAMSTGEDWEKRNSEVDTLLTWEVYRVTEEEFRLQVQETASVFAVDMLLLKFIQGLPVVGILGGAMNPVYYSRILKYVQLKYRKKYLLNLRESLELL